MTTGGFDIVLNPFMWIKTYPASSPFQKLSFPKGQNYENENPFAKWNEYLQDPQDEYNWYHMLETPKPSPENSLLSASMVSMCISTLNVVNWRR